MFNIRIVFFFSVSEYFEYDAEQCLECELSECLHLAVAEYIKVCDLYIHECDLTSIFHMSSIREILTSAVSTSREMAKVLMLASTSLSLGRGFVPRAPFSGFLLMFSRTPTVSCPRDVISSARDCWSNKMEEVNSESKESYRICRSVL